MPELLIILLTLIILFGVRKLLPELAKALGISVREFRKAAYSLEEEESPQKKSEEKKA